MNTDRIRIASHITRTRFLHIEDFLERRKLRFFIGSYEQGRGASATAYTFLDVDDARVVLSDLSWGKQTDYYVHTGGRDESAAVIARMLKIQLKDQKCWVEIKNGPGELMITNAVKPAGRPSVEIQIPLTVFEARRLALACLAYLSAWDVSCFRSLEPGKQDTIQP